MKDTAHPQPKPDTDSPVGDLVNDALKAKDDIVNDALKAKDKAKDIVNDTLKTPGLGARVMLATGFAAIGAKIGWIGTILDVNHLFKDKEMTLGKKVHALFGSEIIEKTMTEVRRVMRVENKTMLTAIAKVNKFGIATTLAGVSIGAILGWTRGGRLEHAHDLLTHPIESFKILCGFKEPHKRTEKAGENADKKEAATESAEDSPANHHWQKHVESSRPHKHHPAQHASHVEALAQDMPSGQGVTV